MTRGESLEVAAWALALAVCLFACSVFRNVVSPWFWEVVLR